MDYNIKVCFMDLHLQNCAVKYISNIGTESNGKAGSNFVLAVFNSALYLVGFDDFVLKIGKRIWVSFIVSIQ